MTFGLKDLEPIEKHLLYVIAIELELTGKVSSQRKMALDLTTHYHSNVAPTAISTYIEKLERLGLLTKTGIWGRVATTVSIRPEIVEQVKEWKRMQDERDRARWT